MERLAALMPHPRLHLIRFHGVLALNTKLRSKFVPAPAEHAESSSEDTHAQDDAPSPQFDLKRKSEPVSAWLLLMLPARRTEANRKAGAD
jgi:hypothetical protein